MRILRAIKRIFKRPPDYIIGDYDDPYLLRWWVIPRNKFFNIYLHKFCRSDDDRALHDHPWSFNMSILLTGNYIEHVPLNPENWPQDLRTTTKHRKRGSVYFRAGCAPHRVQLIRYVDLVTSKFHELPVWTIFITGAHVREWGFYCEKGWRHWKVFTQTKGNVNTTGRGCE